MIRQRNWETDTTVGRGYLLDIQDNVALWQTNKGQLADVSEAIATLDAQAEEASAELVDAAIESGSLRHVLTCPEYDAFWINISPQIARAAVARDTLARIHSIQSGGKIVDYEDKEKARVTVTHPGVTVSRSLMGNLLAEKDREAKVTEVFSGRIAELHTDPKLGGRLTLVKGMGIVIIEGLVDVDSVQPRVNLTVIKK